MTHVDLVSGIGGFSIAAEAAGFTTVAFAETDSDASEVLDYWWPKVPNLGDVTEFFTDDERLDWRCWSWIRPIDLLTGGVPCQPTSHVGLMRGTADPRWLWPAAIRAHRIFRPKVAVYENPPALLILEGGRAFNGIVSEMVALGYDLWWDIFPAAAVGAGHLRERLIIVATDANRFKNREHRESRDSDGSSRKATKSRLSSRSIARSESPESSPNANGQRWAQAREQCLLEGQQAADDFRRQSTSSNLRETSPNAKSAILAAGLREGQPEQSRRGSSNAGSEAPPNTSLARLQGHGRHEHESRGRSRPLRPVAPSDLRGRVSRTGPNGEDWWSEVVTGIPVLAHGLPNKLVEAVSRCTGNAVVPQTLVPLLQAIATQLKHYYGNIQS